MISKGRARKDGRALARYLLRHEPGQVASVIDLRDSAAPNLAESLRDWEICALAMTKGEKPLYHTQIRLADGEHLTRDQWMHVVGKLETRLGMGNCPRAVVGHQLNGELHLHVVWSRLDLDTGKLVSLSHDRMHHHAVARQAEVFFNLRQLNQDRDRSRDPAPDQAPELGKERPKEKPAFTYRRDSQQQRDREYKQAKQTDMPRPVLQERVSAAFQNAGSPAEFVAQLEAAGIKFYRGDRRDFVIDYKGQVYNPVRFIPGMTAAKMRDKMQGYEAARREDPQTQRREEARTARPRQAEAMKAAELAARLTAPPRDKPGDSTGQRKPPRRKPPAPRLRPKLRYGDPGI